MKAFDVEVIWSGRTTYRLRGKTQEEVADEVYRLLRSGGIGLEPKGTAPREQDVGWENYYIEEVEA